MTGAPMRPRVGGPIDRLMPYVWISLGAVAGANARYLVNRGLAGWLGPALPYGTFAVNLAGCVAIGVLATLVRTRFVHEPDVMVFLGIVGFLGSLTTFSAFAWEGHVMLQDGAWMRAWAYLVISVSAGLAGVRLGVAIAQRWGGA